LDLINAGLQQEGGAIVVADTGAEALPNKKISRITGQRSSVRNINPGKAGERACTKGPPTLTNFSLFWQFACETILTAPLLLLTQAKSC
jgi:hypothetical protein